MSSAMVPSGGGNGAPQHGMVVRQDVMGGELARAAETSTAAVAATARAEVEARFAVAIRRPRDMDDVRVRVLRECGRTSFAECARYKKPVGKKDGVEQFVEGPSIRFVEAALRTMGNVSVEPMALYDDIDKRIVAITVTDLETNTTHKKVIVIQKTVERRFADGRDVLGQRMNSWGKPVFIVRATEDEVAIKEAAQISKAIRVCGLRIIPGDLVEEAQEKIVETLKNSAEQDPDRERKRLSDAFASLNVMPSGLKEYLGHDLAQSTPAELVGLRQVYQAIKDGETTWKDALGDRLATPESTTDDKPTPRSGVAAAKAKAVAAAAKAAPAPAAETDDARVAREMREEAEAAGR